MRQKQNQQTEQHRLSQLIADKGAKATQWSRESFSTNGAETTGANGAKR